MSSEARAPAAAGVSAVVRRQAAAEVPLAARLVPRRKRKSRAGSAHFPRAVVKACTSGSPPVEGALPAGGRRATRRVPPVARSARAANEQGLSEGHRVGRAAPPEARAAGAGGAGSAGGLPKVPSGGFDCRRLHSEQPAALSRVRSYERAYFRRTFKSSTEALGRPMKVSSRRSSTFSSSQTAECSSPTHSWGFALLELPKVSNIVQSR